jgi:tetratricopeptide (TPR) repeat protein
MRQCGSAVQSIEQALDIIVPDKWIVCPHCENDCILMDCSGGIIVHGVWSLLAAGRCRECRTARVWCWSCGERFILNLNENRKCGCGHSWRNTPDILQVKSQGTRRWSPVSSDVPLLDTDVAAQHYNHGVALAEEGNLEAAAEAFTRSIELVPSAAQFYYRRALTYDEREMLDEAIADYTQCIALDPQFAMAYASRGIAMYAQGRLVQALPALRRYLALEPNASQREEIEYAIQAAVTAINQHTGQS